MIEDKIFNSMVNLSREMYEEAELSHECSLCGELMNTSEFYMRKIDNGEQEISTTTPYLFICKECWKELPSEGK